MTTNSPAYDAALKLATTVGSNIRTLRKNKRDLARNLVLAVSVEGFRWKEAWEAAKKAAKFAAMEKPEQNGFNVMGTACRTIIDEWADLPEDTRKLFSEGNLVFSTLAATIKDAAKAKEKQEAEQEAGDPPASEAPAGPENRAAEDAPPSRAPMILEVAALFDVDQEAATFLPDEMDAMLALIGKVEAFRASLAARSAEAA